MELQTPIQTIDAQQTRIRRRIWSVVFSLLALQRSRRHLKTLEPHLLRDIGIAGHIAADEAARPVWDAPEHWFRH
jgi:uncharacterized protein YjiS (DUF1127 family)